MKKKVLGILAILFFMILTTAAFAQSSVPSDQEARPGQGYSMGPGMMYGQGQGPGQGQSQDAYGPSMMYGYGVGWMGGYGGIWVLILLVILGAGLVAWIVKRKRQVNAT